MKKASKIILIILLLLILLLVVGPFLIPIQSIGEVEDPSQLAYPDSQFQDVNGVNIHYQKVGQGEPTLLLLHGFAANTSSGPSRRE